MNSKEATAVPLTGNNVVEIIKDRLYWVADRVPPKSQGKSSYFNIDNELKYEPFNADFGPLNLSKVYRFVTELDTLLKQPDFKSHIIYHYCSVDSAKKANAAFLMGSFQVLILDRNADEAWKGFEKITPPFVPFRDASMGGCTYQCTILDCLRGLEYAVKLKWFDLKTFDCRKYEYFEKIENGDLNWIIPNKFVAFSTPNSSPKDAYGFRTFTPDDYSPVFKSLGVTTVVRLSKPQYDREKFIKNGFKHNDLYFLDGSTPSDAGLGFQDIINKFLQIAEGEPGALAVHCKAGLGRTGTLIGIYAMKHYHFPAAAFIGWIRICRPGSVLGPQQHFLNEKESKYFSLSGSSPIYKKVSTDKDIEKFWKDFSNLSLNENRGGMSPEDKKKAIYGETSQGDYLMSNKTGKKN